MRRITLHALAGSAVLTAATVAVATSGPTAAPPPAPVPAPAVAAEAAPPAAAKVATRERTTAASRSSARTAAAVTAVRAKRSAALARERQAVLAEEKRIQRRAEEKAKAGKQAAKKRGYSASTSDPRDVARQIMANRYGWGDDQFDCYDSLIKSESMWRVTATNPSSGAYGIPQALPGRKMASAGADWQTNPATQITWGLTYVKDRYGTPCSAWSFKQGNNWY